MISTLIYVLLRIIDEGSEADNWQSVLIHQQQQQCMNIKVLSLGTILYNICSGWCKINAASIVILTQTPLTNLQHLHIGRSIHQVDSNHIGNNGTKLLSKMDMPELKSITALFVLHQMPTGYRCRYR